MQKELSKEVRNYNKRISYARSKYPNITLSPKLRVKDIKQEITTRSQYRSVLSDLRYAKTPNLIPQKSGKSKYEKRIQKREASRKKASIIPDQQRKRQEALSKIRVEQNKGRFPTEQQMLIRQIGITEGDTENYRKFMEWVENANSMQWKENYLKGVTNSMEIAMSTGDIEAYESLKNLYDLIVKMDLQDFIIGQLSKPEQIQQDYIYPSRSGDSEWAARVERIIDEWSTLYA